MNDSQMAEKVLAVYCQFQMQHANTSDQLVTLPVWIRRNPQKKCLTDKVTSLGEVDPTPLDQRIPLHLAKTTVPAFDRSACGNFPRGAFTLAMIP